MARKKINKICNFCGNDYLGVPKSKFCNRTCQGKARQKKINTPCAFCKTIVIRKESVAKKHPIAYCSNECRKRYTQTLTGGKNPCFNRVNITCEGCKKIIKNVKPHRAKKQKYCSHECHFKYNQPKKGIKSPNYTKEKVKCYNCNIEFTKTQSQTLRSKNHFCSRECYYKSDIQTSGINKQNYECIICNKSIEKYKSTMSIKQKNIYCSYKCKKVGATKFHSGEQHPAYNHNLTDKERLIARKTPENYQWRKNIFERDCFSCQICEDKKGGNLNAHHFVNYSTNKEKRFDLDNGITLCKKCHVTFHNTFGYTNNTKEQFREFEKLFKTPHS